MATRYYFPDSDAAVETTSPDAGWNYASEVSRHNMVATKGSSAITAGTLIGALSGTAGHKGVDRMYFGPALAAQNISGTVSMMLMTREGAGTDNIDRPWMGLYVVNSSGTKVHTLLALGVQTGAATNEWVANASHRTCTFANSATLTAYDCAEGDKILLELGGGNNGSGTSPEFSCKFGENATDATLGDNATTANRAGWIEFSDTLTGPATPVTTGQIAISGQGGFLAAFRTGIVAAIAYLMTGAISLLTKLGKVFSVASAGQETIAANILTVSVTPVLTGQIAFNSGLVMSVNAVTGIHTGQVLATGAMTMSVNATIESSGPPPSAPDIYLARNERSNSRMYR